MILYDGAETLSLGQINDCPLWAMPIATLSASRIMWHNTGIEELLDSA